MQRRGVGGITGALVGALVLSGALLMAGAGRAAPVPLCNYGQITKLADPSLSAPSPTYPGNTITSSGGSWTTCGEPFTGFYKEWLRDGVVISGPTFVASSPGSFTYVAQTADIGHSIRSAVLPCNADGCYLAYAQSSNAVVPTALPPPPPPPPPPADAPVVVSGYVRDLNGNGASGATVELYLDVGADGSSNQSAPVYTTTSDKTGYYVVRASYAGGVANEALANDGWVNFSVEATAGDMPYAQVMARRWDSTSGSWLTPSQVEGASSITSMPVYDDGGGDLSAQPGASVQAGDWPNVSGPCRYASYETTSLLSTEVRPTVIGELHVARDATGTFTYGKNSRADSHISIGVSSGGWHLLGFRHVATTNVGEVSIKNTSEDWAHAITSSFSYGLYKHERWTVDPVTGARISCGSSQTKEARRWLGDIGIGEDLSKYLHLCTTTYKPHALAYPPGSTFDRSSRKLTTWESAVVVGVGNGTLALRAWSGASKYVMYHYAFGPKYAQHWLCGNDDYPLYASRIFAGG